MQTQETDPEPFEREIIHELQALDGVKKGKWKNKRWTREVKNAVGKVAKKRGYIVCASGCDYATCNEWLYDLTCREEEGDYLKGISLVLESEWKNTRKNYKECGIPYDFKKLLASRADHRVMVLEVESDENEKEVVEQLLQHVQKCRHSTVRDRYLFACCKQVEKKWVFNCSVYKVVNG